MGRLGPLNPQSLLFRAEPKLFRAEPEFFRAEPELFSASLVVAPFVVGFLRILRRWRKQKPTMRAA